MDVISHMQGSDKVLRPLPLRHVEFRDPDAGATALAADAPGKFLNAE